MGSQDVDPDLLPQGSSALHCAAMSDDVDSIAEVLSQGHVFIDALDRWGRTPLHAALENGRYKAAMFLIQNQANLNLKNPEGSSAYDIIHTRPFLHFLQDLLHQQIYIDVNPQELVSVAIDNYDIDLLEKVLSYPAVNVNYQDEMKRTALHSAVQLKSIPCVKLLLAHRANVELKDWRDSTALHHAAKIGDLEVFKLLLDEFLVISEALNAQDHAGCNVMHLSLLHKHYHLVTFVMKEFPDFVKHRLADASGMSVEEMLYKARDHLGPEVIPCFSTNEAQILLQEAVYRGDASVLSLLVEQGANLNYFDLMQQTPLIAATRMGHLQCVVELLNLGALLSIADFSGNTPLHYAARLGRTEITLAMLKIPGVRVSAFNNVQETPLQLALLNHHGETAGALLDHLDRRSDENWMLCMECCASWAGKDLLDQMKTHLLPHNWLSVLLGDDEYHFCADSSETLETPRSTLIFDITSISKDYYIPLSRSHIVCPWCGKLIKKKNLRTRSNAQDVERHCQGCSKGTEFYKEWLGQYLTIICEVEREQRVVNTKHKKINARAVSTAYKKMNEYTRKVVSKMSLIPTPPQIKKLKKTTRFKYSKKSSYKNLDFFPIHFAACAGNVAFLDMIFSSIYSLSQKKALLMVEDKTERSLLTLLSSNISSPTVSMLLAQHNLLELVRKEPVIHLTSTDRLLSIVENNSIAVDHWELFLDVLDDVATLPPRSCKSSDNESVLVTFLQKFCELQQDCDASICFNVIVVYKLCKKGHFSTLLELIKLWQSYATRYNCEHQLLVNAAKSIMFHCLECDDVPTTLFTVIMDELITLVGSENSITLVEHYKYFFRSFRRNMTTALILILKLFDLDALNWKLLYKIQVSSKYILLPYNYGLQKFDGNSVDTESDHVMQIVNSRVLCHELFSSIMHCRKTNNLLLGACAMGSIQLVKLLLPITPTSCYVKISKTFHFSVTMAAIDSHDTELLDTILNSLPTTHNNGTFSSCTLAYCCRWLGMDVDNIPEPSQRLYYKQRSPSVIKKAIKAKSAYADCSPFIYYYQTFNALKEAELARRQILDYFLARDDFLSCINSSFSSDFPPPLLVAIQFHWSYGAVQLLLHGADPATHWNNKYALIESIRHKLFAVVGHILDMLSEESTEALMESEEFLPSLVKSLHILASFEQSNLLSSVIEHFCLLDFLWLDLKGVHLISICLHHNMFETANYLMLNGINHMTVVSMNGEDCHFPLLQLSRHIKGVRSRRIEEEVCKIMDTFYQFCILLSVSVFKPVNAFCRACGEGLCEFVDIFLTIIDDSLRTTLLTACDDHQRSPLFHAACSGCVKMVQILFNHGATIEATLIFNHPIVGALAGLAIQVCKNRRLLKNPHNNTILYIKQLGNMLKYFSACEIKKYLPAYTPCEAHLKEHNMVELLELLVSKSTTEISFILTSKGDNNEESLLFVPSIYLLSLLANYSAVSKSIENLVTSDFDEPSYEGDKSMHHLTHVLARHLFSNHHTGVKNQTEIDVTSTLDMVLCVLPWYNEKSSTFEEIMVEFAKNVTPQQSLFAALKGYWLLIKKSVRRFNFRSYSAEQLQQWERILCLTIVFNKIDLAQSILSSGMKSAGINANSPTALHLAVKYGHTQLVNALIYKHGYQFLFSSASLCGFKFHCSALDIAAVYDQTEMMTRFLENSNYQCLIEEPMLLYKLVYLSSLFNNPDCLKVLQKIHSTLQITLTGEVLKELSISTDHLWPNILEADNSTQFWLIALIGSLSRGHQGICREALSRLFYREDDDKFMHYLVDCCCYWGMDVILQDLSLSVKYNFASLEDVVPSFEYSLVGNYFSKLSRFFASSFEGYEKLDKIEEISDIFQLLTVGWFSNLCRLHSLKQLPPMDVAISYQKLFLFDCKCGFKVFYRAVKFNIPTVVQAFLITMDAAVGTIIRKLLKSFHLLHLAAAHNTPDCLSLLLNTLSGQSLLEGINSYDTNGFTPLAVAISKGSIACSHLLVRHGSNLKIKNKLTRDSLVHMAAISGNVEMLKFLVDLSYFQRHKQELNVENSHGITPLVIALSQGYHKISNLLIKELKMSPLIIKIGKEFYKAHGETKDTYSLGQLLSQALGWFNILMEHNNTVDVTKDEGVGSLLFNLRVSKDKLGKVATFCKALKANQESIVQSLMNASHNTLLLSSHAGKVCSKLQLQLLTTHSEVHLKSVKTSLITWLLSHGVDQECAALIENYYPSIPPSSVDYQNVFLSCCIYNGLETAKVIMEKHLCSTDLVAVNGITNCWGSGSFGLATEVLLKTHHAPAFASFISSDSILLQAVFNPSFVIHKAFIDNIKQLNSIGLPEAILIHKWSESDHLLFMEKIQQQGSIDAIRNCRLSLSLGSQRNVQVDIDWISFDNALRQVSRCPLEVESVIFSSLILSDILFKLRKSKPSHLNCISIICRPHAETPRVESCPNMTWLKLHVSYDSQSKLICYPDADFMKLLNLNDTFDRDETKALPSKFDSILHDGAKTVKEEKLKPFDFNLDPYVEVESIGIENGSNVLDALSVKTKRKLMKCLPHVRLVNISFESVHQNAKENVIFHECVDKLLEEVVNVTTHKFKCSNSYCTCCGSQPFYGIHSISYGLPRSVKEITIIITVNNEILQFETSISSNNNHSINILFQFSQSLDLPINYSSEFSQKLFNLATELKTANVKQKVQSEWINKLAEHLDTPCKMKIPITMKYVKQPGCDEEDIFSDRNDYLECQLHIKLLEMLWRSHCIVNEVICLFQHLYMKPEVKSTFLNYIRNGLIIYIHDNTDVILLEGMKDGMALNIAVGDLVRQHLSLTSLASAHLFDIAYLKLLPLPIASYINPKSIGALFYPVVNTNIAFQLLLADIRGFHVTTVQASSYSVVVIVRQPDGKRLTSTSQGMKESSPLQHSRQLTVGNFINGTCDITWIPFMVGVHHITITVNDFPTKDSPMTTFVYAIPKKEDEYVSRQLSPGLFGSGGYPTTIAGKPLVFVVTHPDVPCRPNSCKADVETTRFLSAYVNSSKFEKSFVQRLSDRPGLRSKSSSNEKAVHYLTVYFKSGGIKEWKCKPISSLLLFYQKVMRTSPQCVCIPMGREKYSLSVRFFKSAEFKLFVACGNCQAIMPISWSDSTSSGATPTRCFVVSSSMSLNHCTVHATTDFSKKAKMLPAVIVGTQSLFYIVACDKFGNKVNPDNAVMQSFSVKVLQCGLKFPLHTQAESPSLRQIITATSKDCKCDTEYLNNGVFKVKCTPYCCGNGLFLVSFTKVDGKSVSSQLHVDRLLVKSGPPSAAHSRVHFDSSTVAINKTYSLKLYLFDKHYNSILPSKLDFKETVHINILGDHDINADFHIKKVDTYFVINFVAKVSYPHTIVIAIDGINVPQTPLTISVTNDQLATTVAVRQKLSALHASLQCHRKWGLPTQTVERKHILNSGLRILSGDNISYALRVRFDDECGMDIGGLSKEFFHLLSMELVNPDYALFECVSSGLYKPNRNSSVNPSHLEYFKLTGTMMAKAICEGHNIGVRFTPSVYKYILSIKCDLEDLKVEDVTVHSSLVHILKCENPAELDELSFTVSSSHFGSLQTIELEDGGTMKRVTVDNKRNYVHQMCHWYLTDCIRTQLQSIKYGFHQLIKPSAMTNFNAKELQMALTGRQGIDLAFLKQRMTYHNHVKEETKKWLWEILNSFTQEELSNFLSFCTGSPTIPVSKSWNLTINNASYRGSGDLPTANTCSNTLNLPEYKDKTTLDTKLRQAISLGQEAFLMP